jgi:hypothetical protein
MANKAGNGKLKINTACLNVVLSDKPETETTCDEGGTCRPHRLAKMMSAPT